MYPYNINDDDDIFNISSLNFGAEKNLKNEQYDNLNAENCEDDQPSLDEYILELIRTAILDECEDAKYYEELSRKTNDPESQQVLRKIHLDELKHKKIFEEIYYQLTGEKANIDCKESDNSRINESLIENYAQSIFEELGAVEFYRKILFSFLNLPIRDWLYEIITDEQAHAQKLNYLYSKSLRNC